MPAGLVVFMWFVAGAVVAAVASVILRTGVRLVTRRADPVARGRAIRIAAFYPFVCLGWAAAVFLVQSIVNQTVFHRDPGVGDVWHCPLPNGYVMEMIDEPDYGSLYKAGDVGQEQRSAVNGVRLLQLSQDYMLGGTRKRSFEPEAWNDYAVDSYFLVDTRTSRITTYSSLEELGAAASPLGVRVHLEPIGRVYNRYRFTRFETALAVVFCVPVLFGLALLISRVLRVRRSTGAQPAPV
jgi:hypothetical protein